MKWVTNMGFGDWAKADMGFRLSHVKSDPKPGKYSVDELKKWDMVGIYEP